MRYLAGLDGRKLLLLSCNFVVRKPTHVFVLHLLSLRGLVGLKLGTRGTQIRYRIDQSHWKALSFSWLFDGLCVLESCMINRIAGGCLGTDAHRRLQGGNSGYI
jgi:hypothetical protein